MKDGNSASQMSPWRPNLVIKNEEKTHWKQQQQQKTKKKTKRKLFLKRNMIKKRINENIYVW